jgi:hypothetical protein
MRAAPAVQVSIGPDRLWSALSLGLGASAGASLAAWAAQWLQSPDAWTFASAAIGGLLVAALAWHFAGPAPGRLGWDGERWWWQPADAPQQEGDVRLMMDVGPWMLLRFEPNRGVGSWLPMSRRGAGAAWHALRIAVYSRRPDAQKLLSRRGAEPE